MFWTRRSSHQRTVAQTGATPAISTAAMSHQKFPSCKALLIPLRVSGSRKTQYSAKMVTATWSVVSRTFFMRAAAAGRT